jgi:DNA-binding XRE family transcriptional regulator
MNRKDLLKDIGYKLRKVRNTLNHSRPQMAARIGVVNSSYVRNENGERAYVL